MAEKYCDHGLYGHSASFTASVSGTTLTVTAVSAGRLSVGANVLCAGFTSGINLCITALGTGTGGTGTYTLNHSSNGTVSSQSMTSNSGLPLNIPTWGEAQDGDGTAIGAGTPSTAEVVFTGIASTGAISVLGQAITFTRVTDADTCANNLATAINASTAVATGPASFTTLSQVRNHLYARGPATGAPAGTCQIMTRQASASHAGLIAVTHTLNNVSSPSTINFSGGTGGAWGWLLNNFAIWPSAVGTAGYGLLAATPWCGNYSGGDLVHVRSNKTIVIRRDEQQTCTFPAAGSAASYVTFKVDDSTVWADGAQPVITIDKWPNLSFNANAFFLNSSASSYIHLHAQRYSDTLHSLTFLIGNSQNNGQTITISSGGPVKYTGIEIKQNPLGSGGQFQLRVTAVSSVLNSATEYNNCTFRQHPSFSGVFFDVGNPVHRHQASFNGCVLDGGNPALPHAGVMSVITGDALSVFVLMNNCEFINFTLGSKLHPLRTSVNTRNLLLRNCSLGGITDVGPNFSTSAPGPLSVRGSQSAIASTTQTGNRDFFFDSAKGFVGWISTRSFPVLNAKLHDGVTPWSIQMRPSTLVSNVGVTWPLESPRMVKINTLATGVRTLTVEFGIENSLSWTANEASLQVEYEDASGRMVVIDTHDAAGGALTASSALWNGADASFIYSEAGALTFNRYKISVTTPTAIKGGNSEIGCIFRVHSSVANVNQMVFVDPEIVVT